ncbi:MAG: hypothetical protein Q9220_006970 [cf. Caloplaca sp. 1 TL-2023]
METSDLNEEHVLKPPYLHNVPLPKTTPATQNPPQNPHAPRSAPTSLPHPSPPSSLIDPSPTPFFPKWETGYTQSSSLFRSKTGALHKALTKGLSSHSIHLSYPTGPIHLDPADIPGYTASSSSSSSGPAEEEPEPAYGWWRRKDVQDPSRNGETEILYTGLQDGFARIAETIKEEGPFDGVIGFSQGGCAAAMVASLLEGGRADAFPTPSPPSASEQEGEREPYPASFITNNENNAPIQPPLKFALIYSGFLAPGTRYSAFYTPAITTPTCHFLGAMDTVVEEGRGRALIEVCDGAREVVHPGGHFLPSQRPWLDAAVGFVREVVGKGGSGEGKGETEERVEDMEVPF